MRLVASSNEVAAQIRRIVPGGISFGTAGKNSTRLFETGTSRITLNGPTRCRIAIPPIKRLFNMDYWYTSGKAFGFIPVTFDNEHKIIEPTNKFIKYFLSFVFLFWDILNFKPFKGASFPVYVYNLNPSIYLIHTLINQEQYINILVTGESFEDAESIIRTLDYQNETESEILSIVKQ